MQHGRVWFQVSFPILFLAGAASAQVTQRISVTTSGACGDGHSDSPTISEDGRSVAFHTVATNLISFDTNGFPDVNFRDWTSNYNELVSADTSSNLANAPSASPRISADGRIVVFESFASNLVPGDTNGSSDIFVRNRSAGTTQRVNVSTSGAQADGYSQSPAISPDGRYVVFVSAATNLVTGDTNGTTDIFLRDRQNGVTERISVSSTGAQANAFCSTPTLSSDARYIVFASSASNLVAGDTNGVDDVFLRDRVAGTTLRVSLSTAGVEGNGASSFPTISADGLSVAFVSQASNLITWDTNGKMDVYFRAWAINYNEVVSASTNSVLGNEHSTSPAISADGRLVAFVSGARNLVPGDMNQKVDVFVRNRSAGTTERVSLSSSGAEANGDSDAPAITGDGRFVAFASYATNLAPGDTGLYRDVYVRDRLASGFTSLCHPGVDRVRACPCSNPPSAAGRGCDNSAATGGALLTADGIAYLSMDSLAFTTYAEKPTALSVLMQGDALDSDGIVYGQGVRCVGGSLKRLFARSASSGSITVPGTNDPRISAQSAAKGDVIQPGESRWYLVYYRDPVVLGGCPSSRTFNTTQTGEVTWMP